MSRQKELEVIRAMIAPPETTPPTINDAIIAACRQVCGNDTVEPFYVPVEPAEGCKVRECYLNCKQVIDLIGCKMLYGWLVWMENEGRYLNFVHHAILKNHDGSLVDPTPQPDGEAKILFVPDPRHEYTGHLIAGVQVALVEDETVQEFVAVTNELWQWHEKNTRAHEPIVFDETHDKLLERQLELLMILRGVDRDKLPAMPGPMSLSELVLDRIASSVKDYKPVKNLTPPYRDKTPKERAEERKRLRKKRK